IVLVNDGSIDENSLSIAKEYTLKDERFILIDKENGGLSSARNVGIEFFENKYIFETKTQKYKPDSLVEFELKNKENLYKINKIYKSSKSFYDIEQIQNFSSPRIDYIIFLDSDDYWELDCMEECVLRMNGVDVVWFDYKLFFQDIRKKKYKTQMEYFDFKDGTIIEPRHWIDRAKERNIFYFWFAWQGMINFNFLHKMNLKFINGIFAEDCHFGVLLFAFSKKIFVYSKKKYIYRIRESSLMNFTNIKFSISPNSYLKKIDIFGNSDITKVYYEAISWLQIALKFIEFSKTNHCLSYDIQKHFLPVVCNKGLSVKTINKDPLHLKKYLEYLELYIENQPLGAVYRVKQYLSYRVIKKILSVKGMKKIFLPFDIIFVVLKYQINKKYKKSMKNQKLPLEFYKDYQKAIRLKMKIFKIINIIFKGKIWKI
ncbi:glycosyltransferase, partial [Campylobacter jejuni]|nr:glycosyltransferase [Campylobacter jejuni]